MADGAIHRTQKKGTTEPPQRCRDEGCDKSPQTTLDEPLPASTFSPNSTHLHTEANPYNAGIFENLTQPKCFCALILCVKACGRVVARWRRCFQCRSDVAVNLEKPGQRAEWACAKQSSSTSATRRPDLFCSGDHFPKTNGIMTCLHSCTFMICISHHS